MCYVPTWPSYLCWNKFPKVQTEVKSGIKTGIDRLYTALCFTLTSREVCLYLVKLVQEGEDEDQESQVGTLQVRARDKARSNFTCSIFQDLIEVNP